MDTRIQTDINLILNAISNLSVNDLAQVKNVFNILSNYKKIKDNEYQAKMNSVPKNVFEILNKLKAIHTSIIEELENYEDKGDFGATEVSQKLIEHMAKSSLNQSLVSIEVSSKLQVLYDIFDSIDQSSNPNRENKSVLQRFQDCVVRTRCQISGITTKIEQIDIDAQIAIQAIQKSDDYIKLNKKTVNIDNQLREVEKNSTLYNQLVEELEVIEKDKSRMNEQVKKIQGNARQKQTNIMFEDTNAESKYVKDLESKILKEQAANRVEALQKVCDPYKEGLKKTIVKELNRTAFGTLIGAQPKHDPDYYIKVLSIQMNLLKCCSIYGQNFITQVRNNKKASNNVLLQDALTALNDKREALLLSLPDAVQDALTKFNGMRILENTLSDKKLTNAEKIEKFKMDFYGNKEGHGIKKQMGERRDTATNKFLVGVSIVLGLTGIGLVAIPFVWKAAKVKGREAAKKIDNILTPPSKGR